MKTKNEKERRSRTKKQKTKREINVPEASRFLPEALSL